MTTSPSSPSPTRSRTGGDIGLDSPLTGLYATKSRGSSPGPLTSPDRGPPGQPAEPAGKGRCRFRRPHQFLGRWAHDCEPRDDAPHLLGELLRGAADVVGHDWNSSSTAVQSLNSVSELGRATFAPGRDGL